MEAQWREVIPLKVEGVYPDLGDEVGNTKGIEDRATSAKRMTDPICFQWRKKQSTIYFQQKYYNFFIKYIISYNKILKYLNFANLKE